jgi:hypothetical protein
VLQKAVVFSVVIASIVIPVWAARAPSAARGLKWAVLAMAAFNVLYLVALKYLYWLVF